MHISQRKLYSITIFHSVLYDLSEILVMIFESARAFSEMQHIPGWLGGTVPRSCSNCAVRHTQFTQIYKGIRPFVYILLSCGAVRFFCPFSGCTVSHDRETDPDILSGASPYSVGKLPTVHQSTGIKITDRRCTAAP